MKNFIYYALQMQNIEIEHFRMLSNNNVRAFCDDFNSNIKLALFEKHFYTSMKNHSI